MSRTDEIKKRIAKRKRERLHRGQGEERRGFILPEVEEQHGFERMYTFESGPDRSPVLFKKEIFIFKILASACLFLLTAILFKSTNSSLDSIRTVVSETMENDFQFAAVTEWYEDTFGEPLAFFPTDSKEADDSEMTVDYAVPASGKVLHSFETTDQGITIETGKNEPVKAMKEGVVIFAGKKEDTGQTVMIQHADDTITWYGQLKEINVSYQENVPMGEQVGTVSDGKSEGKGEFYFAIQKGNEFIDPIQVISFEKMD
ncbi:M23 family metallopeptidase [Bacillus litorisediminis]|uniref:M23 family metallopeptidase n=1 Tax=Bacillus litorisediminis TaxID=2922713 RepID=UPI001FAECE29|nr:M23 family metallopeptidase [Bacillus litorisediminis]